MDRSPSGRGFSMGRKLGGGWVEMVLGYAVWWDLIIGNRLLVDGDRFWWCCVQ